MDSSTKYVKIKRFRLGSYGLKVVLKYYAAVYIIGMFTGVLTGNAVLRDVLATVKGEMKGKVISVPRVK